MLSRSFATRAVAFSLALAGAAHAEIDLKNFDLAVKPQDDFYRYVNGTWLKENPIPAEFDRWGGFSKLAEDNQKNLLTICERVAAKTTGATPVEKMVGDFFASGMDEAAINAAGVKPLQPELDRLKALKTPSDVLLSIAR